MKGRKSITFRITILFAAASTAVLLLLGFLIGTAAERHFEEQDMDLLKGKLQLTQHALEKVHSENDLDSLSQQLDDSLVGHHGLAVIVVAPDRRILFASSGVEFPKALLDRRVKPGPVQPMTWRQQNLPLRGISAEVPTGIKGAPPAIVAIATDTTHHEHFMRSFQVTLWTVVVFAAALTGFLGWISVRRGLEPLMAIRREAAAITAEHLDRRLAEDEVPAELAALTETLNEMLTRLQDSFRRLSDFSSDLAHELRTPVSNLLTQTQVTLSQPRTADEYREILASNEEEFERLSRTISDMLFLAKADNDLIVPNCDAVDLGKEVRGLLEFYDVLADEKRIVLKSQGTAIVSGDRLMLRRAISNLLSNAVRHTPAAGSIVVTIDDDDSKVKVTVENTGSTIAAEHLPRLFDRFYRVDWSRHRAGEGAGLGLAITRSILRAHGGNAEALSQDGVTRFVLTLPKEGVSHDRVADQGS